MAVEVLAQLADLFDTWQWLLILIGGMSCPAFGAAIRRLRGVASSPDLAKGLSLYYLITVSMFVLTVTNWLPSTFCVLLPLTLASFPAGLAIALSGQKRLPPSSNCSKCGYDLTGNVSGTCPECGLRIPK